MRRKMIALTLLALFAAAACATAAAPSASGGPAVFTNISAPLGQPGSGVDAARGVAQAAPAALPVPAGAPTKDGVGQSVPIPAAFDPDRMLILTASIAMQAKDPWGAADRAQAVALTLGGDVVGLSQSGKGDQKVANLTLRVPSPRFNEALRQLRDLGDTEIVSSSVEGKDVTEQFVDLDARLTAKKAEEARYLALLARADKIEDILRIDQTLSAVRTQIEQLTGQINSIKQRTQFSTISVSITPVAPIALPGPDAKVYDPSKTAQSAIGALSGLFRVVADLAIWSLVFGWIPLVLLALALALQRTRRMPTPA